ncbi:MAG: acyl-CoA thioesterase [Pseudomonadota bacterium]
MTQEKNTAADHEQDPQPVGELCLQTIAMPANTNAMGDIFGGWLVAQMDLAGSVLATRVAEGRVVTVAIDRMMFIAPVSVGSLVSCYTKLIKIGRTSLQILVEVWATPAIAPQRVKVTEGLFTFVAIDENRRTRAVPK